MFLHVSQNATQNDIQEESEDGLFVKALNTIMEVEDIMSSSIDFACVLTQKVHRLGTGSEYATLQVACYDRNKTTQSLTRKDSN